MPVGHPTWVPFFIDTPTHCAILTLSNHPSRGDSATARDFYAVSLPPLKLSNEWLVRLLFAAASCIGTGATMYASQWWAFLKDAPSRAEVDRKIAEKVASGPWVQERPTVLAELKIISNGLNDLKSGQLKAADAISDQALAIRELQTLIKKDTRP